jgi:hypothetical protein
MAKTKKTKYRFFKPNSAVRSKKFDRFAMSEKFHFTLTLSTMAFGLSLYLIFSSPIQITLMSMASFALVFYSSVKKREYSKAVKNEQANEYEIAARKSINKRINKEIGGEELEIGEKEDRRKREEILRLKILEKSKARNEGNNNEI